MTTIINILLVVFIIGIFLVMSTSVFADSFKPQQKINERENLRQKPLDKPLLQEQHNSERIQRKSSDKSDNHPENPHPAGDHSNANPNPPGVRLHSPPGVDD